MSDTTSGGSWADWNAESAADTSQWAGDQVEAGAAAAAGGDPELAASGFAAGSEAYGAAAAEATTAAGRLDPDSTLAQEYQAAGDAFATASDAAGLDADAASSQEWADWNTSIGDQAATSAADYADAAATAAAAGDTALAGDLLETASNYADAAASSYDTASGYAADADWSATQADQTWTTAVGEAEDATALSGSVGEADPTAYDTTTSDVGGTDTGSEY